MYSSCDYNEFVQMAIKNEDADTLAYMYNMEKTWDEKDKILHDMIENNEHIAALIIIGKFEIEK